MITQILIDKVKDTYEYEEYLITTTEKRASHFLQGQIGKSREQIIQKIIHLDYYKKEVVKRLIRFLDEQEQ